jgi:hypothetical protein
MPRPLRKRLDEQFGNEAVLEFTKKYGRGAAMEKFGVRDSLCFHNYLVKLTGDEHFGYLPTDTRSLLSNREIRRQQIVEAVLRRLANSETLARVKQENRLLDARIAHLLDEDKLLADVAIDLVLSRT